MNERWSVLPVCSTGRCTQPFLTIIAAYRKCIKCNGIKWNKIFCTEHYITLHTSDDGIENTAQFLQVPLNYRFLINRFCGENMRSRVQWHFNWLTIQHSDVLTYDILLNMPWWTNEVSKTFDNQHLCATASRWYSFLDFIPLDHIWSDT